MKRFWATIREQVAAQWALANAEVRTGVRLVEAVAVDEFETSMRALNVSSDERARIRSGALLLAQLGVEPAEIESMARFWLAHNAERLPETRVIRIWWPLYDQPVMVHMSREQLLLAIQALREHPDPKATGWHRSIGDALETELLQADR